MTFGTLSISLTLTTNTAGIHVYTQLCIQYTCTAVYTAVQLYAIVIDTQKLKEKQNQPGATNLKSE